MSFLKRLIGGKSSPATPRTPTSSRQAAVAGTGTWPDGFRFAFAKNEVEHREMVIEAVNQSAADKVLVVDIGSFKSGDSSRFAGRRVFLNTRCSLPELCEACRNIRASREKAVVVSNFPSEVDLLRVSWVEMPGRIQRTWSAPQGTSLEVAGGRDTVAVFFSHLSNTSYYEKVLRAQGWPTRAILECAVLSDGHGLIWDHRGELGAGASEQRVRELLIKGSETLEFFIKRDGLDDEAGILHN